MDNSALYNKSRWWPPVYIKDQVTFNLPIGPKLNFLEGFGDLKIERNLIEWILAPTIDCQ